MFKIQFISIIHNHFKQVNTCNINALKANTLINLTILNKHFIIVRIFLDDTWWYLEKMKTQNMKIQPHFSPVKAIVNISKRQVTTPEKSVLNKGLNFTTIKMIPYWDLIAPIENAALNMPKAQADEQRWEVRQVLE